jgi:predicted transcriptional regulator
MRASDVMHRGVVACSGQLTGVTAAEVMVAHGIHSVVVTAPDSLPRVLTDAEVADAVYGGTLETSTAGELARPSALVQPSDTLSYVIERMHEYGTTHVVVTDRSGRLLGVVSVLDLVEAIAARREE